MIWNILDASSVAEIRERRLRIRYAVVSAVLNAGYLPLHESSLTRLVDKKAKTKTEEGAKEKVLGSFETFGIRESDPITSPVPTRDGSAKFKQLVTLVWTGKETPMDADTINSVMTRITRTEKESGVSELPTPNDEPYILHHGSSDDLERYVSLAASNEWPQKKISFMRATIPPSAGNQSKPWALRGIITDDLLVDALINELSQRIPALSRPPGIGDPLPRIVVIAESDTRYSQAILNDLHTKLTGKAQLGFYSYLRGLDGRSENVATTPESMKPESRDPVDLILQRWGIAEKSSGTSQFDYLRRLALRLSSQTKKEKELDVAVGVLGSDIYDKMLVLQAVRRARPSAIFFTTDLDALYLEQESEEFTRNLVVASADSLDVSGMPPMRDAYQSVVAKKVLNLLTPLLATATPTPASTAQVFEIATGQSIALDAPDVLKGARNWVLQLLSKWYANLLIFGLALGNAFLILGSVFTRKPCQDPQHEETAPMKPGARAFVYLEVGLAFIGAVSLAILCIFWSDEALLLGEPLALGISVWPSVMIRLLAFVVAIRLLLFASRSLVAEGAGLRIKLEKALRREIQLPLSQDLAKESLRFYRSLANESLDLCRQMAKEGGRLYDNFLRERATPSPEQSSDRHLTRFFGSDEPPVWWRNSRLWRLIMWSVIYFAISVLLFRHWPPSVPCRGAFALLVEKIVLALGVTLYIVHLVFCLDLHVGAYKFIRTLRSSFAPAGSEIDAKPMLEATSALTAIIGKTLLYPLTVLILIILSRLPRFDNWVMTPSLTITFSAGALALMIASLSLWSAGSRLKKDVLEKQGAAHEKEESKLARQILEESSRPKPAPPAGDNPRSGGATETKAVALARELEAVRKAFEKEKADLVGINDGVFAAWYSQPIFAAIFSAAAVFGSLSVAGPLARLFFG